MSKGASLFALFFAVIVTVSAQKINYYQGHIALDKDTDRYQVQFTIDLDSADRSDTLKFYLHKDAKLLSIISDTATVNYDIKTEKFIGDNLVIYIPSRQVSNGHLTITYLNSFHKTTTENFQNDKNWKELNIYTVWFPLNLAYGFFEHTITINSDQAVVGSGQISKNSHTSTVTSKIPSFDIPLIINNDLRRRKIMKSDIVIYYDRLHDTIVDHVEKHIIKNYQALKTLYGEPETEMLAICLNDFNRGIAYARPSFVSMSIGNTFSKRNMKTLAHEISHLWWNKADVMSYEDWLNESFAEYSALLLSRSTNESENLTTQLESLSRRVQKLAPIYKIDKLKNENSNEVLTYKGAYLLLQLEQQVGKEIMIRLLRDIHKNKITTTAEVINSITAVAGRDVSDWFLYELKR